MFKKDMNTTEKLKRGFFNMLPSKSHLQLIVKELEKFNSEIDKSYNFQEFFDRCRAIFTPAQQTELKKHLDQFKADNIIDSLSAQNILYKVRVKDFGGKKVLKVYDDDHNIEKVPLNINKLEYGLRGIVIWCRKIIIKIVRDEQIDFEKMSGIDTAEEKK